MISIQNYFSTQIPVPFAPVYCAVFARPLVKGESTRAIDPLLIHSFIQNNPSHSFSTSATKARPQNRTWCTARVSLNPTLSLPPPRLTAYQRTGNSSRRRHACHGCFLLTRFRRQPAGFAYTHTDFDTTARPSRHRPAHRNTRTSACAWLMYAHAKTN